MKKPYYMWSFAAVLLMLLARQVLQYGDRCMESKDDFDTKENVKSLSPDSSRKLSICSTDARLSHIGDVCQSEELRPWLRRKTPDVWVDQQHKMAYCMIAKVASSSMRYFLSKLINNKMRPTQFGNLPLLREELGIKTFSQLTPEEQQEVRDSYFKFMIVRHPLDRLVSAWRDKLAQPKSVGFMLEENRSRVVDDYFRERGMYPGRLFNSTIHSLSMEEFLSIVAAKYSDGFGDMHWQPFVDICNPCVMKYDNIFRLETLERDQNILYEHLKHYSDRPIPEFIPYNNKTSDHELSRNKLDSISRQLSEVSAQVLSKLSSIYSADMSLFGYEWDNILGAECNIRLDNSSQSCC